MGNPGVGGCSDSTEFSVLEFLRTLDTSRRNYEASLYISSIIIVADQSLDYQRLASMDAGGYPRPPPFRYCQAMKVRRSCNIEPTVTHGHEHDETYMKKSMTNYGIEDDWHLMDAP
ncbi:hypothetical protein E4U16_000807, partial [Claviceps sp. LM84 group G4]